jgi:hypothetical protein
MTLSKGAGGPTERKLPIPAADETSELPNWDVGMVGMAPPRTAWKGEIRPVDVTDVKDDGSSPVVAARGIPVRMGVGGRSLKQESNNNKGKP